MSCGFETSLAIVKADEANKLWSWRMDKYIIRLYPDDYNIRLILQAIINGYSKNPLNSQITFSMTMNYLDDEWIHSASKKLHDNKFLSKYYTINISTKELGMYGLLPFTKFNVLLSYKIPRMYILLAGTQDKHTKSPILRFTRSVLYDRQIWRVINKLMPNNPELPKK